MYNLSKEQIADCLYEFSPMLRKENIEALLEVCCPVALATIPVKEQYERDFSIIDGMVLYMYSIGYRSPEVISKLTAIDRVVVEGSLNLLIKIEKLIDPASGMLTPRGAEAMMNFREMNTSHGVELDSQRNIQIEAVTGSVFPSFLETDMLEPMPHDNLRLLPALDRMMIDEILYDEINNRLKEYIDNDLITNGDVVVGIGEFTISKIMYRKCHLVKYSNMMYPLIVFESTNSDYRSRASQLRNRGSISAAPVSFSEIELIELPNIIKRRSDYFDPLLNFI